MYKLFGFQTSKEYAYLITLNCSIKNREEKES